MQPPPIHYQPGWRGAINLAAWKNSRRLWEAVQANSGRRYKPCRRLTRFTFTLRLEIFREREKKKREGEKDSSIQIPNVSNEHALILPAEMSHGARIFLLTLIPILDIFSTLVLLLVDKKKIHPWKFSTLYVQTHFLRGSDYTWIRSTRAITGLFTQLFFLLFHRLHTCKCTIINSRRIDIRCVYIIYNRERKLRLR